jgi:hypothetical protein
MSAFSRRKGAAAEREFINGFLRPFWPKACRNIDQHRDEKSDCLNAGGCHWQIKRQERTEIWAWIAQAEAEAPPTELPIVAFRRNRSKWYCVIDADELVTLLRLREGP